MKTNEESRVAEVEEGVLEEGRVSEPLPRLLAEIAEPNPEAQTMTLRSGRVIEAHAESQGLDRLTIKNPSGEVELEIRMTERGPLLKFRSADVELEATRDVKVSCNDFHVQARGKIVEEAAGDLRQQIRGNAELKVRGNMRLAAREAKIEAKRGNVKIDANDDVEILGERIKLNC